MNSTLRRSAAEGTACCRRPHHPRRCYAGSSTTAMMRSFTRSSSRLVVGNVAAAGQRNHCLVLSAAVIEKNASVSSSSCSQYRMIHSWHNNQHDDNHHHHHHHIGSFYSRCVGSLKDTPSFQVARIYFDGKVEFVSLKASELLRKETSIYARDLFTLNLTSRQERQQQQQQQQPETNIHDDLKKNPYKSSLRKAPSAGIRRSLAAILPRNKQSIVLSFGIVRAVATLDHLILFEAHHPAVKDFAKDLGMTYSKLRAEEQVTLERVRKLLPHPMDIASRREPDELIFLEHVLRDTVESYNRRLRLYEPIVENFLDQVSEHMYSDSTGVHQLGPIKDSLQSFEIQVKQALDCLEDLLNDDDEMLALLLTEQYLAAQKGTKVDFSRHEHVELMIGVYARQISNIYMEINYLLGRIQSKQEFVALTLASYRNRMVRMNVHLGITGLAVGFSTAVAGFFGMNLVSGFEQSPLAFQSVVLGSCVGSFIISAGCLNFLSGRTLRNLNAKKLDQIETLTEALSDMTALDHALKSTLQRGMPMNKDNFLKLLKKARNSKQASPKEVDLLFDIFDTVKDGNIDLQDFDVADAEQWKHGDWKPHPKSEK